MSKIQKRQPGIIGPDSIAPCGMDCAICIGSLRDKKTCPGCNADDARKSRHCLDCRIKNCAELADREAAFCYVCSKYPCARMRQLDKRYRTRYGMSMVENLEIIRDEGLEAFVERERERWRCPQCGGVISVHRKVCLYCGWARSDLPDITGAGSARETESDGTSLPS